MVFYHIHCVSTAAYTLRCLVALVMESVSACLYLHVPGGTTAIYNGCLPVDVEIRSAHCESTEMFVQMENAITKHSCQGTLHVEETI
jgi:hypothetical protein